jgi:hypothetical protein
VGEIGVRENWVKGNWAAFPRLWGTRRLKTGVSVRLALERTWALPDCMRFSDRPKGRWGRAMSSLGDQKAKTGGLVGGLEMATGLRPRSGTLGSPKS